MLQLIGDMFSFWVTGLLIRLIERLDNNARLKRLQLRGIGWNPEHVASLLSVIDPLDTGSRKKVAALYRDVAAALVELCPVNQECSQQDIEAGYFDVLRRLGEYPPAFERRTARLVSRLHAVHSIACRNWHADTW